MKRLICVLLAGVLLGGTIGVTDAEANGRKHGRHRHHEGRDRDRYRDDDDDRGRRRGRYFSEREVYLVRDYYGPRYRYEARQRHRHRYYRSGYLPRGWHRRMRPYPVYIEREVIVLPHGHRRGIIDGHAVVYNSRAMIVDVAILF